MKELFPPDPEQPPARPARRNIIWDSFVEIFGYEPRSQSEIKLWGKLTWSLNRAGATRESLLHAAREYKKEWPTASLTPHALEKHYSRFAARLPKKVEVCEDCGLGGGLHVSDCRKVEARAETQASKSKPISMAANQKGDVATA